MKPKYIIAIIALLALSACNTPFTLDYQGELGTYSVTPDKVIIIPKKATK